MLTTPILEKSNNRLYTWRAVSRMIKLFLYLLILQNDSNVGTFFDISQRRVYIRVRHVIIKCKNSKKTVRDATR